MIKIETYAQALYEVVSNPLEVYEEIKSFNTLLEDEEVRNVFQRNYGQAEVLDPLWDLLNMSAELKRLLKILQKDQRIIDFDRFIESYQDQLTAHKLISKADVRTAHQLDDQAKESLKTMLAQRYPGVIEISVTEEPELIKGMVVKINNDVIDTSIKNKLQQIRNQGGK